MQALRVGAVAAKTSLAESTIWAWSQAGWFPKPFPLGASRVVVWDEADIDEWLTQQKEKQHESDGPSQ